MDDILHAAERVGLRDRDPFVIALAKVFNFTMITEQTGVGSLGKIPGVCNTLKVLCINLMQLIDVEDWVLG